MLLKEYAWIGIGFLVLLVLIGFWVMLRLSRRRKQEYEQGKEKDQCTFVVEKEIVFIHADEFISIEHMN